MLWTVVIPAKAFPAAKTRLTPATTGPEEHLRLVEAIRADAIAAAVAAPGVARVVVVADRPSELALPEGPTVLVQVRPGLNGALLDAAEHAAVRWPDDAVAALVGDLPALRPDELGRALADAAGFASAFVPDAAGTGTTLLTASPGTALVPRFGPDSAALHARTARALDAGPGLRRDVDVAADLHDAARLGLGAHTSRVWPPGGATPGVHDDVA